MARKQNTKVSGGAWSEVEITSVWIKGSTVGGIPANIWRQDSCGNDMKNVGQKTDGALRISPSFSMIKTGLPKDLDETYFIK